MRWVYSGRKLKAASFVYIQGSLYRDVEGSSQLWSCLHDEAFNSAPGMGERENCISIDSVHLEGQMSLILQNSKNVNMYHL